MPNESANRLTPEQANTAVLTALARGPAVFDVIRARVFGTTLRGDWRAVDRALQRLKKRGAIRLVNRRWELVPEEARDA